MKVLQDILYKVNIQSVHGRADISVTDLQIDSRKVSAGSAFVALEGSSADGHRFIQKAIEQGAIAILCRQLPANLAEGITYIQVADTALAAGIMAHNYYDQPSVQVKLVGVTGTNGKTTIATLLYKLFTGLGYACGLISTVQNHIGNRIVESTHTTPDAISLNALLREMVDAGCSYVFMETSSHALQQQRTAGLKFTGAIFSNISHDHLDYHKTFDEYIRVKKSFFDQLPGDAFAIVNIDDKRGRVMLQNCHAKQLTYSLKNLADYKGKILENNLTGLVMIIDEQEVHFRLIGEFNAYNLLAVYGAARQLGADKSELLEVLSSLTSAEGRFDYIVSKQDAIVGIIDYAHTPDALVNVLETILKLRKGHESVITVIGCGGDRDRAKRPLMAEAACKYSNRIILTADNPRTEDPMAILAEMEEGLNTACRRKQLSIVDRREAIKVAVSMAGKEDIILIAGKGHEKYQEIQGVKYPFDDKVVLREMFEMLEK